MGGTEKKEEKEKIPNMCESIGHRPLRGRCPKGTIVLRCIVGKGKYTFDVRERVILGESECHEINEKFCSFREKGKRAVL